LKLRRPASNRTFEVLKSAVLYDEDLDGILPIAPLRY